VTTLTGTNRAVVRFYNQRGTAEQWIKEGKPATHWTRLSCHRLRANEVRLLLGVIAYNLGNLLRRLALPIAIQDWSLTSLQQRLLKTGGRLIRHARYFTLQLAESYLTESLFRQILARIERWRGTRHDRARRPGRERADAGGRVPAEGGHRRQALEGCGIGGAGATRMHRYRSQLGSLAGQGTMWPTRPSETRKKKMGPYRKSGLKTVVRGTNVLCCEACESFCSTGGPV
jgi:hypothetical protein